MTVACGARSVCLYLRDQLFSDGGGGVVSGIQQAQGQVRQLLGPELVPLMPWTVRGNRC